MTAVLADAEVLSLFQAIVLGVVQGLAEFLPISSSGHLILVPWLFGWEAAVEGELAQTFDVALHLGTLVGLAAYFRADLARLGRAGIRALRNRRIEGTDERLAGLLILATLPGLTVGAFLELALSSGLRSVPLAAGLLVVFGLVLAVADRSAGRRPLEAVGARDALVMGVAQSLALAPGVSRSGATISAGRFLGLDRQAAARMSFLMSLPITAGAVAFEGARLVASGGLPAGAAAPFLGGMAAAAITGVGAVWGVLKLVRTRAFTPFVIYRLVAGFGVLAIYLWRSAGQ
ncbi:MAG: undecaprenyl-diphosphate phosphatase [Acidimicrobiales bacterium]